MSSSMPRCFRSLIKAAHGLIGLAALLADAARQVAVMIPPGMIKLDEPDVALGQSPRQQAVGRERAGLPGIGAVSFEDTIGLVRDLRHLGHGCLHPVGHLVLGDPGLNRRIEHGIVLDLVQLAQPVEHLAAPAAETPGGILEVEHRVGPGANSTPWCTDGRNPLPQSRE